MQAIRCGLPPGSSRAVVAGLNDPLRVALQQRLQCPVELVVGMSSAATGEALRRGALDIAYLSPVSYILQSRHVAMEPFARPSHDGRVGPTFQSVIIVPRASEVQSLATLRGSEIAMSSLVSTSGCWVPRYMLMEAGLTLGQDYERRLLGTHEQVVRGVAAHAFVAGGVSLTALRHLVQIGVIRAEDIRVLALSPPIPECMWVFRAGLDVDTRDALRHAFIGLRDQEALLAYRAESFIPAVDADVDRVRGWMEAVLQVRLRAQQVEPENPLHIPVLLGA